MWFWLRVYWKGGEVSHLLFRDAETRSKAAEKFGTYRDVERLETWEEVWDINT